MDQLANDYPNVILAEHAAPCLSLYQPTHRQHPENLQDPIRFANRVKRLTQSLRQKYPRRDVAPLLAPLQALAKDSRFWNRTLDGLAVLAARISSASTGCSVRSPSWPWLSTASIPGRCCASCSLPIVTRCSG